MPHFSFFIVFKLPSRLEQSHAHTRTHTNRYIHILYWVFSLKFVEFIYFRFSSYSLCISFISAVARTCSEPGKLGTVSLLVFSYISNFAVLTRYCAHEALCSRGTVGHCTHEALCSRGTVLTRHCVHEALCSRGTAHEALCPRLCPRGAVPTMLCAR